VRFSLRPTKGRNIREERGQAVSEARRPLGVWLFTTVHFLGALLFFLAQAPWFLFPPRHAQLPPDALAWVFLASVIVFTGATYGTWAGSRFGRNVFLSLLAIMAAIMVYVLVSETFAMLRSGWEEWMRDAS